MALTEGQWLEGVEVFWMLNQAHAQARQVRAPQSKAGRRRLRLLACACARLVWGLLDDERSRAVVEVAERFAEGQASDRELTRARLDAEAVTHAGPADDEPLQRRRSAHAAALHAAAPEIWDTTRAVWRCASALFRPVGVRLDLIPKASWRPVGALLHEIFGNPFRPVALGPAPWLAWNGGTVAAVARTIAREGAFGELPALLDALQEAGCDHEAILAHLRGPGPHVRGCWALDLLSGPG
jgi:hypothetical protein